MSDSFIAMKETVFKAVVLIHDAQELIVSIPNPVDSSYYRIQAALLTALAEISEYDLKMQMAMRKDWESIENPGNTYHPKPGEGKPV